MTKRLLIFLLLLLVWVPGRAQFFRRLDNWLKARQEKQPYDTTYIYRPQEKWLVRTRSLFWGESLSLVTGGVDTGNLGSGFIVGSGLGFKQTIGGGYRNLTLDLGYAPFGKKTAADFSLRIFGNRFGLTVGSSMTFGYAGGATAQGQTFTVQSGDIVGIYGQISAYYAVNGRRFSFPAAMNQSYRQLHSAGSLFVLASARALPVIVLDEELRDMHMESAICALAGAGLGYGYNWVPSEHWLVHACLNETVGIWNSTVMSFQDYERDFKRNTPIFVTTGSFAVLYYYRKWYFGLYADFDSLLFAGEDNVAMMMGRMKSSTNLTIGVRF